jgi:hypothetical protein
MRSVLPTCFRTVERKIKRFRESVIRMEEHIKHCPHYGGSPD